MMLSVHQLARNGQYRSAKLAGGLYLGRLRLPACLPFSKPNVNWLLHRSPQELEILGDPNQPPRLADRTKEERTNRSSLWSIADSNRSPQHCQCCALAR